MRMGVLFGVGIGPGDPELITVKGASLLSEIRFVFVPKAADRADSLALSIVRRYLRPDAQIVELVFPMCSDREVLSPRWIASARQVADRLRAGEDACFLTLGDPSLYSTWSYLRRALTTVLPEAATVTIPGVPAACAAAALAEAALGEGKQTVTIVPTGDDMDLVRRSLARGGTTVFMKIGRCLPELRTALAEQGALDRACLVARAGLHGQRVIRGLRRLEVQGAEAGYLSIVLVPAAREDAP